MLNEFKKFAMKGNMVDMAVGIVIGAAFGAIISSLVDDVIMPPIGLLLGGGVGFAVSAAYADSTLGNRSVFDGIAVYFNGAEVYRSDDRGEFLAPRDREDVAPSRQADALTAQRQELEDRPTAIEAGREGQRPHLVAILVEAAEPRGRR